MGLQPKAIVGLKVLLDGGDLELGGNKYFFDSDGINLVGSDPETYEDTLTPVDMSLNEFIRLCNEEPEKVCMVMKIN